MPVRRAPTAPGRRTTTGGPPGSWSSPPTRTTPSSGRPARPPAGSTQGSVGWLVCCTSGDQGGEDPDADPLELAALRETEQRAAAAVIGYAGVTFLHQPDGALANDLRPARAARPRDPDVPARTRSSPPTRRPSSTATAGSTTPTIAPPGWPRSMPSTRPRATRWRSRALARDGLAAHRSGGCTCSGRTTRLRGSTSRRRSTARSPRWPSIAARSASRSARHADPRAGRPRRASDRCCRRRRPCGSSSSTTIADESKG